MSLIVRRVTIRYHQLRRRRCGIVGRMMFYWLNFFKRGHRVHLIRYSSHLGARYAFFSFPFFEKMLWSDILCLVPAPSLEGLAGASSNT